MKFNVRVDGVIQTTSELKQAKREINKRVKEGLTAAGKEAALPRVRAGAPSLVRPALTVKARTSGAYITTQGPIRFDRIAGLLNFGGTLTEKIVPRDKEALKIGGTNAVVAAVNTPRRYKGSHFIEKGVYRSIADIERVTTTHVIRAFDGIPHEP